MLGCRIRRILKMKKIGRFAGLIIITGLLLVPKAFAAYDVYLVSGTPPSPNGVWDVSGNPYIWTPDKNDSHVYVEDILNNLATANVLISTGSTGTQTGDIYVQAAINYTGMAPRTLSLVAANDISINSTITGADLDLVINSTGNVYINSSLSVRSLTIDAAGAIFINCPSITTSGSQAYGAPVNLLANTSLSGGPVVFTGTVDSAVGMPYGLTVNTVDTVIFNGPVGAVNALSYLDITAGANIQINGDSVVTTGTQSYNGNVILNSVPTTFLTVNADLVFSGDVIGAGGDLTVNTGAGMTVFGRISNLGNLQVLGIGQKIFSGSISNVSGLNVAAGGVIFIISPSITTMGSQTYGAPVNLLANTSLSGGSVVFASTLDSPNGLTVNASGTVIFNGSVGSVPALSYLDVTAGTGVQINAGSVVTTGPQSYTGNVILNPVPTTFSTTNADVVFSGDVTGAGGDLIVSNGTGTSTFGSVSNLGNLKVLGIGQKIFNGSISDLSGLDVAAGGIIFVNSPSIMTIGSQTYGAPVNLLTNTALSGGSVVFAGTVDSSAGMAYGLTVNTSGTVAFNGPAGTVNALSYLNATAGAVTLHGGSLSGILTVNAVSVLFGSGMLSVGTTASITATDTIGNAAGAGLAVLGHASFGQAAVDLGNQAGDTMQFGSLTFNSTKTVNIATDTEMSLVGGNTGAFTLTPAATLADPTPTVFVEGGATLDGTGLVNGRLQVKSGGTVRPGGSESGTLTVTLSPVLDGDLVHEDQKERRNAIQRQADRKRRSADIWRDAYCDVGRGHALCGRQV